MNYWGDDSLTIDQKIDKTIKSNYMYNCSTKETIDSLGQIQGLLHAVQNVFDLKLNRKHRTVFDVIELWDSWDKEEVKRVSKEIKYIMKHGSEKYYVKYCPKE